MASNGDHAAFYKAVQQFLDKENAGHTAVAFIRNGKLDKEIIISKEEGIDRDSLFATASFSKWLAAYAVMTLVEDGKLDLDQPVNSYLQRWQLPDTGFDTQRVTARTLLSHTAGLNDGLGFADIPAEQPLPGLVESLNAPLASSGEVAKIAMGAEAGEWDYSGGGYLVLELLVEDVSGQSFEEYLQQRVFQPLGMTRSTYAFLGAQQNIAHPYGTDNKRSAIYQYASSAATGLSTSLADLEAYALAQIAENKPAQALSETSLVEMQQPHGSSFGADIWGLGVMLYAPAGDERFVYGHDGQNEPAINSSVRINPVTGDAMVALTTGAPVLASRIGYEWVLWQTGMPDFIAFDTAIESSIIPVAVGASLILVLGIVLFTRRRK
jgi:CubicO group peptidase (beta-lactamase class C family)